MPRSNTISERGPGCDSGLFRLPSPDKTAQNDIPTGSAQHSTKSPTLQSGCHLGFFPENTSTASMKNSFFLLSLEVLHCCCWILLGAMRGQSFNVCLQNGNDVFFHTRHRGFCKSFGLSEIARLMSYWKHLPGQWSSLFPQPRVPGPGRSTELLSQGWVLPFGKGSVRTAFKSSVGMSRMGPGW